MSYRIERIEVEGFRGFRKRKELKLGENLVIVSGPQRSG
jgi:chromosome segregation ATPase